ncbi:hypothetical protein [Flectobacillus major]|jgi:transposase|uniref:hypothetical protein n=1 Tax=Flectobacillus major TaxID=103 RepID=UPI0004071CFB|nr:hypothetical protein [Flectobacillus major]
MKVKYTQDMIIEVLNLMITGKSMNSVSKEKGIPISTIYNWKQQNLDYYTNLEHQKESFRRLRGAYTGLSSRTKIS